jgi:hypothetical protein
MNKRPPGIGPTAAARSSSVSSQDANPSEVCLSGRRTPAGGMAPERSFRTTFSQVSGAAATSATSTRSRAKPAVLAKQMREANARGAALGLTEDELAFYDALEVNDSAVKVLGDETLRTIARELVATVRANVTIDWTLLENVRAQLRVIVKRILRKHGYPPDKQEKATQTVLEPADLLSEAWVSV